MSLSLSLARTGDPAGAPCALVLPRRAGERGGGGGGEASAAGIAGRARVG